MIISRRKMLMLLATSAGVYSFHPVLAAGTAARDKKFFFLSQLLTGEDKLDPDTGIELAAGLRRLDPNFDKDTDRLMTSLQAEKVESFSQLSDLSFLSAKDKSTATEIVRAWYLGRVGNSPANGAATEYDAALMFRPTDSAISIPGFPVGGPEYWTLAPKI